jgi:cysteine protease ATG4
LNCTWKGASNPTTSPTPETPFTSWANDTTPSKVNTPFPSYSHLHKSVPELDIIRQDVLSKLWFTYRKNFVPIGGDEGLTTDKGWGCMLRCGQMVLAQALITLHLGRNWMWEPETRDPTYLNILSKFMDKRQAPFSIHQIAMMGVSENKEVGQWFGPNTVAQVLK